MKKIIGKPENWQDFESLCKKLWGELWQIPNNIKKNGRLGQTQYGVDVYGIPNGKNKYCGIQCKGKDDYSNARLTENDIVTEIEKAKKFQPELEVFIVATTSNKDAKLEQFVRIKDIENQKTGSFSILLYCWEDIADLIEGNQDTFTWYQHGINQKGKFDFNISFNNRQESLVLTPIFEKEITRFKLTDKSDTELLISKLNTSSYVADLINFNPVFPFKSNKINKSWCDFDLVMENTGSSVLEDWRIKIKFIEGVSRLDNGSIFFPNLSPITDIDDENKIITYRPISNSPLIQKDNRYFNISLLPEPDSKRIVIEWELLARDFNRRDLVEILIKPNFVEKIKFEEVNKEADLKEDQVFLSYYVVDKENKDTES